MRSYASPGKKDKRKAKPRESSKKQDDKPVSKTANRRPEAVAQQKLQNASGSSSQAMQLKAIQKLANKNTKAKQAVQLQAMAQQHAENRFQQKEHPESKPIQQKKNKTGMPDHLKTGVENMSGVDMSDVKVHYNSPKPTQLQAHAYAQGTDIHLAPGKEKHLPHEAWHVVQQKQGRVKPTMQLKGTHINNDKGLEKEADTMGNAALQAVYNSQSVLQSKTASGTGVVQREWVEKDGIHMWDKLTDGVAWFANGPDEMWYHITNDSLIKEGTLEGYKKYEGQKKSYDQWRTLRLGASLNGKLDESESTVDKVDTFVASVTEPVSTAIGYEGITGISDKLLGRTVKTGTGGDEKYSKEEMKILGMGTGKSRKEVATGMGIGADTITGLTGITAFAKGLKDATNPDKDLDGRFVAFLEYEQGAMSIGESASKLTATATGSGTAAKFGSTFEGFAAGFGAIKNGFLAIKKSVELVKAQDLSSQEKMQKSGEVIHDALNAARDTVLSVKSFYELATGSASGALMAAVPGADIAISAVKLTMQGYYAIQAYHNYVEMNKQENEIVAKTKVTGAIGVVDKREKMEEASDFYRKNDAKISNKQSLIAEDKALIKELDEKEKKEGTLDTKDTERKKKRKERIERLEKDIEQLKENKHSDVDDGLTKENLAEFTMVQELKSANKKRGLRQIIHVTTEMASIAGSVMTLSGVAAIAGATTKGLAKGVELGVTTTRLVKQKSRTIEARKEAKKPPLVKHKSMYDTTKSDPAKKDFRLQQVRTLVKMAIAMAGKDPKKFQKDFKKLKIYITAMGVNPETLFKKNGKPDEQINMLFEAISEREII